MKRSNGLTLKGALPAGKSSRKQLNPWMIHGGAGIWVFLKIGSKVQRLPAYFLTSTLADAARFKLEPLRLLDRKVRRDESTVG